MTVTADDLRAALENLGLEGRSLCLHASLTSFARVAGGARTVVDTILAVGCTLLVPTFTAQCAVPAPAGRRYPRNGLPTPRPPDARRNALPFSPAANLLSRRVMGVIPAAVLTTPGRARGNHPLNSFTAVGPRAESLVRGQAPLDVYAPLRALIAARGWVVLMGVGLTRCTLIHVAERAAGRQLFRRWGATRDGIVECEVGSCERRITVGASHWRVFPAAEALEAFTQAIRAAPRITRCGRPGCARCPDAIAGGPIVE